MLNHITTHQHFVLIVGTGSVTLIHLKKTSYKMVNYKVQLRDTLSTAP